MRLEKISVTPPLVLRKECTMSRDIARSQVFVQLAQLAQPAQQRVASQAQTFVSRILPL